MDIEVIKIHDLLVKKKIKRIVFIPSKTVIWEIKSNNNNNIYWMDFVKKYCSCKGFYYNNKNRTCYHIRAVDEAITQNGYEIEFLQDSELNNYLDYLIDNLLYNNI